MGTFLILSDYKANKVRGTYDVVPAFNIEAELQPVKISTGEWVLPVEVLDDPAYASMHKTLSSCTRMEIPDEEFIHET